MYCKHILHQTDWCINTNVITFYFYWQSKCIKISSTNYPNYSFYNIEIDCLYNQYKDGNICKGTYTSNHFKQEIVFVFVCDNQCFNHIAQ